MPTPQLKTFAQQSGKSLPEVEKLWQKAKKIADEMGEGNNYAYVTGVLQSMLGLDEQSVRHLVGAAYSEAVMADDGGASLELVKDLESEMQQQVEMEGPMISAPFIPVLPETPPKDRQTTLI